MNTTLPGCGSPRRSSEGDVRLAYAERPDGMIAHISEVVSGLASQCICPGCGADLVARKGDRNEHHFGHRSTAECAHALESALHKLAKEVLHDRKEILLPEVGAGRAGRSLVTHRAEVHQFDDAVLEQTLGSIVPDVIVRKGEHRLLVEMYVTHRCGSEKIARIRAMGLSCVEIDLSPISRRATREEVEQALLSTAHRYWLNNPKLDRAATMLEQQIESERADAVRAADTAKIENERRLDKLAEKIVRQQAALPPRQRTVATLTMRRVADHGFRALIGHQLNGDYCFSGSPQEWQAEVVSRFVIAPLEQRAASHYDFHASDVFRHLKARGLLAPGVLAFVSKEDEPALVARVPGFKSPFRVIESFLWQLEMDDVIVNRGQRLSIVKQTERAWSDRRERMESLDRQQEAMRSMLDHVLQKVSEGERQGFDPEQWWRRRHPRLGTSFAEAFKKDDPQLPRLSFLLNEIESMLFRGGKIVDDLIGLPIADAVARETEVRRQKADAERRQAELRAQEQANERIVSLENEARLVLHNDAPVWMGVVEQTLGTTPRAAAACSENNLARAFTALRLHARERARCKAVEQLCSKLLAAAAQMRRPEHARVFLMSANPDWAGRRPIDSCVDVRSFEHLKRKTAKVAG